VVDPFLFKIWSITPATITSATPSRARAVGLTTHYQVGTTPVPAPSTVHQIAVTDQQYVSGGQLGLAGPAATV